MSLLKTFEDSTIYWVVALFVAAAQNGVAIFAVISSSEDRLSDAACLGGAFGTLGSLAILGVVVIWAVILAVKSFKTAKWHDGLKPLGAVALSSTTAIFIGLNAVLGCTV